MTGSSTRRLVSTLTPLMIVAGAATAQSFDPPTTIPAVQRPSAVATGLFNADGFVDVAFTVDGPDRILVFHGDGAGAFTAGPVIMLGAGVGAGDLVTGEFGGGPEPDLAVALQNSNAIRTYINNAGAGFTLGTTTAVGTNPRGLTVGDHNCDGAMDIACANRDDNTASVLTSDGLGGFAAMTLNVGLDPRQAAFIALDNDCDLDLAVSNHDDRSISVFTNNGAGFALSATLAVNPALRPDGIVAADFNNDGAQDLAAATETFATVWTNVSGSLTNRVEWPLGGDSADIIAGDFDCNGSTDLATANQNSGTVSVINNTGAGGFGAGVTFATGASPTALAMGDFDANASNDLAVANRDSNTVSIALNTCTGDPGPNPDCQNADVNGDGTVDLDDLQVMLFNFGESCN
ncbi:MAG: VCBS repeat-containing protein [Phycisphaerales bacterium]|nr:VCBS repeat-containing protein [Phycisphaerales bacterium]